MTRRAKPSPLEALLHPADDTGRARAAALLALGTGINNADAGRRYGVTREAVRQARAKLGRAPAKPGRPRSAVQRSRFISARLSPGHAVNLRVSDEEHAAFPRDGLSAWLRALLTENPCPEGTPIPTHLRRIARRAAGMPEE